MATNSELIEDNLLKSAQSKSQSLSVTPSASSMVNRNEEEKQEDGNEKRQNKSENSLSDLSTDVGGSGSTSSGFSGAQAASANKNNLPIDQRLPRQNSSSADVFEHAFEASMADLEDAEIDGYETDSESANEYEDGIDVLAGLRGNDSDDLTCISGLGIGPLHTFPRSSSFEYASSSDSSDDEYDGAQQGLHSKEFPIDSRNLGLFHTRPYLLPFNERRRLSQCKEEDEDDADKSPQPPTNEMHAPKFEKSSTTSTPVPSVTTPPPPPPPPLPTVEQLTGKFKDLERLRQQFMHKIDSINTSNIEEIKKVPMSGNTMPVPPPPPPTLPTALLNLLQAHKNGPAMIKDKEPQIEVEPERDFKPKLDLLRSLHLEKVTRISNLSEEPRSPRSPSPETLLVRGKFLVTKAQETPEPQQLRHEAEKLKHLGASANAHTISFPSSFGGYSSIQGLFSQRYGSKKVPITVPHLSKKFFDSSMVEIRSSIGDGDGDGNGGEKSAIASGVALNQSYKCDSSNLVPKPTGDLQHLDDVWIKRPTSMPINDDATTTPTTTTTRQTQSLTGSNASSSGRLAGTQSEDEQDGRFSGSRPSSAPAEPNAKAAKKASKKMEKEAKRQEKELNRREKEARKLERETARRLEREAAKAEKLSRNTEKISRSTERVGTSSRSGSLERRRSGEDSPVLNQSTVHGIASPNRRPTIFDVFRPRAKSEAKRKEKLLLDPTVAAVGGVSGAGAAATGGVSANADSSSASSTHSGAGGLMNSMKVAMQNSGLIGGGHHNHHHHQQQRQHPAVTITSAEGAKSKYKDGSAHPHQGSDAQYYHTVTAVRRSDASRSPMTKVMDLFRHRSNSAASEADKRKARAAAHQQQLAVQSHSTSIVVNTLTALIIIVSQTHFV